ncbi:Clarin-3, partial [Galemys pyrenaicus]
KTLMFLAGFSLSLASLVLTCYALGAQGWVRSAVAVSDYSSNGSVIVTYGLFVGHSDQQLSQGIGENEKSFKAGRRPAGGGVAWGGCWASRPDRCAPVLDELRAALPKTLHSVAIVTLVLSLCSSLLGASFTFYNSVSNPYQTFLGPVGVYTWSALGAFLALVTMVLCAANIQANKVSETLVEALYSFYPASTHRGTSHSYGAPFWLLLLVICLDTGTAVVVVFYQRARRQRKQEQRKPVEHAPRDGILF